VNSRERVLAAIEHRPVDRIPCDIWATPEIWDALKKHFGTDGTDEVRRRLGVDGILEIGLRYTGKDRTLPDGTQTGIWGLRTRRQELPTCGVYEGTVHNPLRDVTDVSALEDFNWEDPADYDFEAAAHACREAHRSRVVMSGYQAPFVDLWNLFGVETALLNLALRPELIEATLDKVWQYRREQHRLLFEATRGCLDLTQVTDDFGCQRGLVMSRETIRTFFWPYYRRAIQMAHEDGLKVFHHDDGAMSPIIPDLIEMGVAVLNPVQWRCPGMEMEGLKRRYGKHLCFHGAVDNQEVLPFGSPDDVRREVRRDIRLLASDGTGYIISPCHNIQSGTPLENVLALYDEIQKSGRVDG
jgi:uroporphyrinogen decarboxylase